MWVCVCGVWSVECQHADKLPLLCFQTTEAFLFYLFCLFLSLLFFPLYIYTRKTVFQKRKGKIWGGDIENDGEKVETERSRRRHFRATSLNRSVERKAATKTARKKGDHNKNVIGWVSRGGSDGAVIFANRSAVVRVSRSRAAVIQPTSLTRITTHWREKCWPYCRRHCLKELHHIGVKPTVVVSSLFDVFFVSLAPLLSFSHWPLFREISGCSWRWKMPAPGHRQHQ